MNLLVVNWQDRLNPQAGGAEIHLHEIFGRLATRGHRVTLLVSGWDGAPRRLTIDDMEVHRTGGRHTFSVAAPRYYRRRLIDRNFDVVVEDLNKVPVFAPLWARRPVALVVHHLFGTTAFQEASVPFAAATWLLEQPLPLFYRNIPVAVVSGSTRDDMIRRGFHPDRIEVIENGVDLAFFTGGSSFEKYATPTVLYVGRLKKYKRVDLIIEAVALLRTRGTDVRFVIAGRGDATADLRALAQERGIADLVEFAGFVTEEQKRELFHRAWVHALTSPKEGWGISNLEAAACGTPTVASDAPGLRDSVVDGETGFLVPHGDVAMLADRLAAITGDSALRDRLGSGARAFAARHSWDRAADLTERHLGAMIARGDDMRRGGAAHT